MGRQEQTVIHLIEHDIQLPQQEYTVECGVFTTCYHQAVFELSQQKQWRCQDRDSRLTQLIETLSKITASVAAQKQRTTRETLYRHGQRISLRVEEQMGQMLTDISTQTEPTTQQPLRRGQKRKAEISSGKTGIILNVTIMREPMRNERTSCDKVGECMKSKARGRRVTSSIYEART